MIFSKSCTYAIRAILYLAVHASPQKKYGVKALAEQLEVPMHFLGKILQQLTKHNLISSVRGPGGGFFLSKTNLSLSISQIVIAIDGPSVFESCVLGLPSCGDALPCPLHHQVVAHRNGLKNQLTYQTVQELANRIRRTELRL